MNVGPSGSAFFYLIVKMDVGPCKQVSLFFFVCASECVVPNGSVPFGLTVLVPVDQNRILE